jgi:glycosyltransferase involved in cell wall biosynthesis
MVQRGDATGYGFWQTATNGLPVRPAGPGSEALRDGVGQFSYEGMLGYLRHLRAYLYTGTRPASYTLGLIEAMMSGTPILSIGRHAWGDDWGGADLFEGDEIVPPGFDDPKQAHTFLRNLLTDHTLASELSASLHTRAVEMFGIETIGAQWKAFLS